MRMFASALKRYPVWVQLRSSGTIWRALTGSAARQYAADYCQSRRTDGFMRKVTGSMHGTLASGREERLPGSVAESMSFHNTLSVPNHRLLVVTDGTERAIGREDRPMHDPGDKPAAATLFVGSTAEPGPRASTSFPEQGSSRLPFVEDGVFIVDADSGRVLEPLLHTQAAGRRADQR